MLWQREKPLPVFTARKDSMLPERIQWASGNYFRNCFGASIMAVLWWGMLMTHRDRGKEELVGKKYRTEIFLLFHIYLTLYSHYPSVKCKFTNIAEKGSLVLNDLSEASSFSLLQRMDMWGPQAVHQDLSHLSAGQTVTLSSLNDKCPPVITLLHPESCISVFTLLPSPNLSSFFNSSYM